MLSRCPSLSSESRQDLDQEWRWGAGGGLGIGEGDPSWLRAAGTGFPSSWKISSHLVWGGGPWGMSPLREGVIPPPTAIATLSSVSGPELWTVRVVRLAESPCPLVPDTLSLPSLVPLQPKLSGGHTWMVRHLSSARSPLCVASFHLYTDRVKQLVWLPPRPADKDRGAWTSSEISPGPQLEDGQARRGQMVHSPSSWPLFDDSAN